MNAKRLLSAKRQLLHLDYELVTYGYFVMAAHNGVVWARTEGVGGYNQALCKSLNDGQTFDPVHDFGKTIQNVHITPRGVILVAIGNFWSVNRECELYRSTDGINFTQVLAYTDGGAATWSIDSDEEGYVFTSEYGYKTAPNNARKIYRSTNDGANFTVCYNPNPVEGYHNHKIIIDPYNKNTIYQAHGDHPTKGILRSTDRGANWALIPSSTNYQPTAAVVFKDHILWGKDFAPYGVVRQDKATDVFRQVLSSDIVLPSVYSMMLAKGVVYAALPKYPNTYHRAALYVSRDEGEDWSRVRSWGAAYADAFGLFYLVRHGDWAFCFFESRGVHAGSMKFKLFN